MSDNVVLDVDGSLGLNYDFLMKFVGNLLTKPVTRVLKFVSRYNPL